VNDKQAKLAEADAGYRALLPANSPSLSLDAFPIATRIEWVPSADVAQFSRRDPSGASYGFLQSEAKTRVPALVGQFEAIDVVRSASPVRGLAFCLRSKDSQDPSANQPFVVWFAVQVPDDTASIARQAFLNAHQALPLNFDALTPLVVVGQRSGRATVVFDAVCPRSVSIASLGVTQTVKGGTPQELAAAATSPARSLANSLKLVEPDQTGRLAVVAALDHKWQEATMLAAKADAGAPEIKVGVQVALIKNECNQKALEAFQSEMLARKTECDAKARAIQDQTKAGSITAQVAAQQVEDLLAAFRTWVNTNEPKGIK
jgi:hypothetical protein